MFDWLKKSEHLDTIDRLQFDEVFEKAVAEFGGSLHPASLDDHCFDLFAEPLLNIQHYLEYLQEKLGSAYDFSGIKLGYVCDDTPNGFSFKAGGYPIIGVNSGFVDTIIRASFTLFANRYIFEEVGNAEGEVRHYVSDLKSDARIDNLERLKKEFYTPPTARSDSLSDLDNAYDIETWSVPLDDTRRRCAQMVIGYAVEFAFLHELSHLFCGHLDLSEDERGLRFVDGKKGSAAGEFSVLENYFLEWDADVMAAQQAFGAGLIYAHSWIRPKCNINILKNQDFPNGAVLSIFKGEHEIEDERQQLIYLWSIAVILVLLVFSQDAPTYSKWSEQTHPHPLARVYAMLLALGNMPRVSPTDGAGGIFEEQVPRAFTALLQAWNDYSIPGVASFREKDFEQDEVMAFLDRLMLIVKQDDSIYYHMKQRDLRYVGESIFTELFPKTDRSQP